ncbi:MAG: glycoside hydrolase [Candidatus Zixiibacteriota bacterium]|nr:MAG: glycoside hydrolase [candidate division Zixibacteria bacterium]
MPEDKPVKLAILWHMHQPDYREPLSSHMVMPWVRLHALKDYLDMPLLAGQYDNVKVTFNLVPSLLDQIELYLKGGTDPHLELSRVPAGDLDENQRRQILRTFFSANPSTMIQPHRRYHELYRKAKQNSLDTVLPALFTSEEIRDLQVWSNLVWIDPMFRDEEPLKTLFAKEKHFTEDDKIQMLNWQMEFMKRIVPAYQQLYADGKVDISFTPYYHPILPLLCDTDVAREALPKTKLPEKRFVHPEDAKKQVAMSVEKFKEIFGVPLTGMWPSEGSISEEVARIMLGAGIEWIATDEEILLNSLKKAGVKDGQHPVHAVYEFGPGLKIFFRDHLLSDRIGFVYSGMNPERAIGDFITNIHKIRENIADSLETTVIPVILDGENAWEYFPEDGHDFLTRLYERIGDDPLIETITMGEAARTMETRQLKSLFAGSWINHNFRIWIGHPEDNAAWDLLTRTRDNLVQYEQENPGYDRAKLRDAWNQIYVAEGSDWCWWYGDEHRGSHNEEFDKIYRRHLIAVYEILELDIPFDLLNPIYQGEAVARAVEPDDLVTPVIDGRHTHFYEWTGAGFFDCGKAGGSMHRADRTLDAIHFAYDHHNVYIRLDFDNKKNLDFIKNLVCRLVLFTPQPRLLEIDIRRAGKPGVNEPDYQVSFDQILEIAIKRTYLFETGFGDLGFTVTLLEGETELETWPESDAITLEVPDIGKEMFWPE